MKQTKKCKIDPKLFDGLDQCKTPEELVKFAKAKGIEVSLEEAKETLSSSVKGLTDDELDNVAGGRIPYPINDES